LTSKRHLFTVVIASLCDEARSELLKRACSSVRAMAKGHDHSIIVVANGPRVSTNVLDWLGKQPDVRLIRLRSGSHPLARRVGAEMADCEFLAFLDDDDELMPDTLGRKIAYFREHPEVDVLVTDGLRVAGSAVSKIFPLPAARSPDFIETLMKAGWGACALTLRTQNVDLSAFDAEIRHIEWTLTTLLLARKYRFGFIDEPTYRYYQDTPDSLSKMSEHALAAPVIWRRLLKAYEGTPHEPTVRRRLGRGCGGAAQECVRLGLISDAWRLHLQSLLLPGATSRVRFTARLMLTTLRTLFANKGKRGDLGGVESSLDATKRTSGRTAN
jgi:hypothetical protein